MRRQFDGKLASKLFHEKLPTMNEKDRLDHFKNFLEYISFKNLRKDEKIDDDACRTDEADTAAAAEKE